MTAGSRVFARSRWLASIAAGVLAAAASPLAAEPVSPAIKVDHFGYRPADAKVAVFTADPGMSVAIRNSQGQVVYTVPASGGSITAKGQDGPGSFDNVWWVDFSGFATPGTYHLFSATLGGQSYDFEIRSDVYQEAFRSALRTFYRQRCNTPRPAAYAGAWADEVACHLPDQNSGPGAGQVDRGIKDLTGGWHDAGDYNKYVWADSGTALVFLLRAYEDYPAVFGDDLGIPESGNGVPDVLDEVNWELDWFLKMQLPDGSVLSRTHVGPSFQSNSPPSADNNVRSYSDPNLESGSVFAGSCALGARVYAAAGMAGYAATLKSAAQRAWSWLQTQGDSAHKAWAAAEVFRMDASLTSARDYVDAYSPGGWAGVFLNVENFETHAALAYVQSPGATPAVVANMKADIVSQVDFIFASDDLYRNGMPDFSYSWGSNRIRAAYGAFLLKAALLGATGSHTAAECRAHALDFLRFFHGQNALNMLYLTNMAAAGGEHSSWQFYHAWFGDSGSPYSRANHIGKPASVVEHAYPYFAGVDNHGVSDNNVSTAGPAPGFVVGGPNRLYGGDARPPLGSVGFNRFYRDWCEQRFGSTLTYEITENSISYQAPYVTLGAAFATQVANNPAALSIDDRTVAEGGAVNAAFRLVLSAASTQTVTVQYSTANATAVAGSDYTSASGTLSFTPGRTQNSIFVPIVTDATAEGSETFFVNLSNPTGATLADPQGIGTITDPPAAAKIAMYRSYNKSTDYHFFTTDLNSKNFAVGTLGFQDESTPIPFYVWNSQQPGTTPLFRMYNPNLGRHFYTASSGSRDFIMGIGGVYEKEEGFVFPLGTSPVPSGATELFLLYNNNSGTHLFTADANQKNAILSLFVGVWVQHTSVGYVFTMP